MLKSCTTFLLFPLITGSNPDVREKHEVEWLKIYFEQFASDLKAFGYEAENVYPFDHLKRDYEKLYGYGFQWALQHTQVLLEQNEGYDMEKIKDMEPSEVMEIMEKLKYYPHQQSKTNKIFRDRSVGLIQEALKKNYL